MRDYTKINEINKRIIRNRTLSGYSELSAKMLRTCLKNAKNGGNHADSGNN